MSGGQEPVKGLAAPHTSMQQPPLQSSMQQLLHSLLLEDYEPCALQQLMGWTFRYVTDVLLDAEAYSVHAGKQPGMISSEHVLLAMQARSALYFSQPPSQDEAAALAQGVNDRDLPVFPRNKIGLHIPDDKDCLLAPSWELDLRS
eukprot:CAMPEP_0119108380 /NCGR_PEP_ID=MMETSP1180-20130426/14040_1 /TAXON_ID=3052 ORGANISM="Chlamydomonas cf sp, Strain CCMP681" /NCGR_SAMPLE_ID=MMETSP1180 /ASSEMBLY_ACC=CAM_ASM_000741 /LENGTH=144 /DNA_ID=CAMNT_0007093985 /DNA_START=44 /DNA_END=478 /DNA_ORIENTATION=-